MGAMNNYLLSLMTSDDVQMLFRMLVSVILGAVIGIERGYRGRAAGLRTYVLVCLSSTIMMIVPAYPEKVQVLTGIVSYMDPTRVMQGITTGIGFLGAGVIFRENFSTRGLTTAASIWLTSSLGVLVGVGFLVEAVVATAITFIVLTFFGKVGKWLPTKHYSQLLIKIVKNDSIGIEHIERIIKENNFNIVEIGYGVNKKGSLLEYKVRMWSSDSDGLKKLNRSLMENNDLKEYSLNHING